MTRGRKLLAILLPTGAALLLIWLAISGPTPERGPAVHLDLADPAEEETPGGGPGPGSFADPEGSPMRESAGGSSGRERAESATSGCSLAGTVRDPEGRALSGVTVALLRARSGLISVRQPLGVETRTSGTGEFLFRELACDAPLALEFRAPGFTLLNHGPIRLQAAGTTRIPPVLLERGLTLTGLVRSGPELVPIEGASVMVERIDRPDGLMTTLSTAALIDTTDGRGRFDIDGIGFTQYRIRAEAPGYAAKEIQRSFLASRHLDRIELSLELEPASEEVEGQVQDAGGRPVAGARIIARAFSGDVETHQVRAVADDDGQFRLAGLSRAEYRLRATCSGYSQVEDVRFEPGQSGGNRIELRLVQNGGLRGRVIAADGGAPIGWSVEVVTVDRQGRRSLVKRARPLDDQGRFLADDLAPGTYHLWASAENSAATQGAAFELRAGETLEGVTLTLNAGGSIAGTIQDGDGRALPGAEALLMPADLDAEREQAESLLRTPLFGKRDRTDASGQFRLAHVPPGEYKLRLLGGGGAVLIERVQVAEGQATDLGALRIERGGALSGLALDQDGSPLSKQRIVLISKQAGYRRNVWTDGEGRFSVSSLPPGPYRVALCLPESFDPYAFEHEASTRIEAGSTTTVTVHLRRRS